MWPFKRKAQPIQSSQLVRVASRPDYWTPYRSALGYLPPPNDPEIMASLRKALPMLDAAIDQIVRLTGNVEIQWDSDRVQADWDAFAADMRIAPLCRGFNRWLNGQQERALTTGTGCSELILDQAGREIRGLQYISGKSLRIKTDPEDPTQVIVAQQQNAVNEPVVLDRDFITLNAHAPRDDSPYGRSIFADIPFIAEMLLEMAHAETLVWERTGAPSQMFIIPVPAGLDPSVDVKGLMDALLAAAKNEWQQGQHDRKKHGTVRDFFAAGDMKVITVGADGQAHTLDFQIPWRAACEQIVSVTHLPSWMLGFHWSTSERLSDEQAQALEGILRDYQDEYTPSAMFVADWWARINGYSSAHAEAVWPEVGLRDKLNAARAELTEAMAAGKREENARKLWQTGVYDQEQYAQAATGEDIVEIATPMEEPPSLVAPADPTFGAGTQLSAQGRSLTYSDDLFKGRGCRCHH